jgi:hypothetical protein
MAGSAILGLAPIRMILSFRIAHRIPPPLVNDIRSRDWTSASPGSRKISASMLRRCFFVMSVKRRASSGDRILRVADHDLPG